VSKDRFTHLFNRLLVHYGDAAEAEAFLRLPQKLLGGETPYAAINDGRIQAVERLIDQLDEGVYL
jgi:uncharacterized protein (DUF2384 family)